MTPATMLYCDLFERAQCARQLALRADAALAAHLATPAYLRRDPAVTVALQAAAVQWAGVALRAGAMRWTWRTVVWTAREGLRLEVGQA